MTNRRVTWSVLGIGGLCAALAALGCGGENTTADDAAVPLDAPGGGDDAGRDAFVAPDLDAFVGPDLDAFVAPDLDAFLVPGEDAFVTPSEDAFVTPSEDAFVTPEIDANLPDTGPIVLRRDAAIDGCTPVLWYTDCDRDGFASTGARGTLGCAAPTTRPLCGVGMGTGGYTSTDPAVAADCDDRNMKAFPGQTAYFDIPTEVGGTSYDYDCDGRSSREHALPGVCRDAAAMMCEYRAGFVGDLMSVPACGVEGDFIAACIRTDLGCAPTGMRRRQRCR